MEIVSRANHNTLLGYLPHIKSSLEEWKLVDIRLTGDSVKFFAIGRLAELVHSLFKDKEGKIYMCNERELFLLIRWGLGGDAISLSRRIEERMSAVTFEIIVHEPNAEGLQRLEMFIRYQENGTLNDVRCTRRENVILVAADEKYMSLLVKMGISIPRQISVQRVLDSYAVLDEYRKHVPDILFLEMGMRGKDASVVLADVLDLDPDGYVIMLTDSGIENVNKREYKGAKGFIARPFSQAQLMEYLKKCPSLS